MPKDSGSEISKPSIPVAQKGEQGGFAPVVSTPVTPAPFVNPYEAIVQGVQENVNAGKNIVESNIAAQNEAISNVKAAQEAQAAAKTATADAIAAAQAAQPPAKTTGPTGPANTGSTSSASTGSTTTVDPTVAALKKQITDLQAQIDASKATTAAATAANQQNAITFLTTTFTDMGLSKDIAAAVTNLVQQGYTADTIQMIAQDPKSKDPLAVAFQQRFPANAARMDAGLPVLSPAEYIATERSYAQVLQAYGLPASFANNKDIFTKLLTNDVSPTELNNRASTAKQVINNTDPLVTQQLQTYYGLSQGDMIAHVLDPQVATPIIEKQISAAQIGAQSARYGVNVGQQYAEQLSGLGITQAQANQGFQNIAQQQPSMQQLADRYKAYTPEGQVGSALQAATFGTTGAIEAQQSLERLKMQEVSQFSGSSGAGKGSLMGTEAGMQ